MKQNKLSILFPFQDRVEYQLLSEETWHNLGLDAIVEKVAQKPQEIPLLQRVMSSLSADPAVCAFRCDVFEDLFRHPEIRSQLTKLLDQVKMFYDYGVVNRHSTDEAGVWDLMHRLEEYHDYIVTVEAIRACLSDQELVSEGLRNLLETISDIYESNGFAALRKDVEELRTTASNVKSLTIGVNLNDRFEAISMGLITVNAKPFTRSGILKHFVSAVSFRDDIQPEADWNGSMTFQPAAPLTALSESMDSLIKTGTFMKNPLLGMTMARIPRDDGTAEVPRQMDNAASQLVSRLVRRLRETLAQYINVSVKEISDLIPELTFYVRWAEYIESLRAKGWTFSKPLVRQEGGIAGMDARGFYNMKLIDSLPPDQAVKNDLIFDDSTRLYLLTGANRGGKTTVTQAIGQLFLLAQSGVSVPADAFSFHPADLVLTHFPADEDRTLDLGRLGEECQRFRELYQSATGNSLLLMNETFSTTSFEEGYFIAVDAVRAILRKNTRTIYNTHMHKLALELNTELNTADVPAKAVSLIVETIGGHSTFHVKVAPPEGKSYAHEIAEKYGVTYEALTASGGGKR